MSQTVQRPGSNHWSRHFSGLGLIVSIAVLFVCFPFVEDLRRGPLILSILVTIVLISALFAIAGHARTFYVAAALALISLGARWLHLYRPDLVPIEVFLIGEILLILFVIVHLLRFVLAATAVDSEVLFASISAYLLLGLLWTMAYWLVAELIPAAFAFNTSSSDATSMKGFDAFYFSFITLCTVGYGDITPVSKVARMLAAMEAIVGLLYVAVLIARLVALHTSSKSNES